MSPFTGSASRTEEWRHLRLTRDRDVGVATVTLARPAKLNALTFGAYADLRDLLAELSRERSVRALVLAGEGRGFCSGGDVDEIIGATLALDTARLLDFNRMTGQVVRAIRECPFPVVAAVHGVAAGAGAVLALAADFRIADPSARFAFLFTRVGLSGGDMGAAYLLPRVVGLGHATRLLMLGEPVAAAEAERIGLISELTGDGLADARAAELARRLAEGPALAYAQTKALLTAELDMPLAAAVELDAATQALLMNGADYREFHAAFTEKRPPKWQGR
ncbi:enoyl-CoA hydratase family protein [Streptomyces sp. NPDC102274]|uniref:enoyl-CoA hydratase family protein n=1 Tax=Streptomyces sp. NPDC102274 TaxID=3366151 RepID=UPI0037F16C3C